MSSILVVDDSAFSRKRLRDALKEDGYTIQEATTVASALVKLEQGQFSCVLTDLIMPGMDGFDLLSEMRKRKLEIPVMVLTADVQKSTRSRCEELGATAVFTKPYTPQDIRSAVARSLEITERAKDHDSQRT